MHHTCMHAPTYTHTYANMHTLETVSLYFDQILQKIAFSYTSVIFKVT